MITEALSGSSSWVPDIHSPRPLQQEGSLKVSNGFPKSKEEFREYLNSLSMERRLQEGVMFNEDLRIAGLEMADFIFWQTIENTRIILEGRKPKYRGGAEVIVTGFATPDAFYRPLRDYLGNRGRRAVIYHPEAPLNVKPVEFLIDPYTQFLIQLKQEIGDGELNVIAHSKGVILNVAAILRYPDVFKKLVSRIINLGGPVSPEWVNSTIGWQYLGWLDYFGGDDFDMTRLLERAGLLKSMRFTSIANPDDRIIRGEHEGEFIPIRGSHSGMPYNRREVLSRIPEILARPSLAA